MEKRQKLKTEIEAAEEIALKQEESAWMNRLVAKLLKGELSKYPEKAKSAIK